MGWRVTGGLDVVDWLVEVGGLVDMIMWQDGDFKILGRPDVEKSCRVCRAG